MTSLTTHDFVTSPHPFLSGMPTEYLRRLSQYAVDKHFAAGAVIFREGQPADRFYLIERGKILIQSHAGGRLVPIQTLGAGEVLGWSWLFPPCVWHFDACTTENTDAISIPAAQLRDACELDPAFGYQIMKRIAQVLVHRVQGTRLKLVNALNPVEQPKITVGG
jgi:CRP/FNR family cyclic AMP-dependent transcriptional regulator